MTDFITREEFETILERTLERYDSAKREEFERYDSARREEFERLQQSHERSLLTNGIRIRELAEENEELRAQLKLLSQQPHMSGTLPPASEIQKIQFQVFHSPKLTAKDRSAGHSEWSVKIEAWHRNTRLKGVDVALHPLPQLYASLKAKRAPQAILREVESVLAGEHGGAMWGGMVRSSSPTGGREYISHQVVVVGGHNTDNPNDVCACIMIGESDPLVLDKFIRANGTKAGSAMWFARWQPEKKSDEASQVLALHATGHSLREISLMTGVSKSAVQRMCAAM